MRYLGTLTLLLFLGLAACCGDAEGATWPKAGELMCTAYAAVYPDMSTLTEAEKLAAHGLDVLDEYGIDAIFGHWQEAPWELRLILMMTEVPGTGFTEIICVLNLYRPPISDFERAKSRNDMKVLLVWQSDRKTVRVPLAGFQQPVMELSRSMWSQYAEAWIEANMQGPPAPVKDPALSTTTSPDLKVPIAPVDEDLVELYCDAVVQVSPGVRGNFAIGNDIDIPARRILIDTGNEVLTQLGYPLNDADLGTHSRWLLKMRVAVEYYLDPVTLENLMDLTLKTYLLSPDSDGRKVVWESRKVSIRTDEDDMFDMLERRAKIEWASCAEAWKEGNTVDVPDVEQTTSRDEVNDSDEIYCTANLEVHPIYEESIDPVLHDALINTGNEVLTEHGCPLNDADLGKQNRWQLRMVVSVYPKGTHRTELTFRTRLYSPDAQGKQLVWESRKVSISVDEDDMLKMLKHRAKAEWADGVEAWEAREP